MKTHRKTFFAILALLCAFVTWGEAQTANVAKTISTNALTAGFATGSTTLTVSATGTIAWTAGATLSGASDFRTAAGLAIGTNVQAYDADLTTWAGITPGTGVATALAQAVSGSGSIVLGTSPTITTPTISGAIVWPDGTRQTFNPDGTAAGLNVGSHAGDPSAPSNGDLWYDSVANELTARINGANVALGAGSSGLTIGTTTITSGTSGRVLYNNAGVLGEKVVTGSGDVVLATAPSLSQVSITSGTLGGIDLLTGIAGSDDGGAFGGTAGTIHVNGGDAASPRDGGDSGSINLDGADTETSANGGNGGSLTMVGAIGYNAGSLTTSGGVAGAGGSIDTSGGASGPGGSITTANNGGSINTAGTGSIQLGADGTRTTLTGSATTNRAISLPDAAGTLVVGGGTASGSNTSDVTLAGTPDYITISGQTITRAAVNLTTHVTGTLPATNGGTGITALGTGIATALGVNVGSAGAPVLFDGAGGTPSSLTLTNATGLPPAGVTGTAAILTGNTFTGANTITLTSLGTTPTAGHSLINSTAAAAGAQQVSPSLVLTGQGWKTNATAASQQVDFRAYVLPIQGAAAPTAELYFQSSINGGAFGGNVRISSDGSVLLANAGSNNTRRLCFTDGINTATIYGYSSTGIGFDSGGVAFVWSGSGGLNLPSYQSLSWSNSNAGSGYNGTVIDLLLWRESAAVLQQGTDANGSPVPQAHKAHDGITGTNIAGANFSLAGGSSTGTGRGGDLISKTANSGTSGTTANSYTTREYHAAKWVDLTESTATTVANVAVASGKYAGLRMICTITADDATDYQSLTSEVTVDAVNKAGTVTTTITQGDNTTAASAGTLTCTYTAVVNGNSVDIKANAASSLTQSTLRAKWSISVINTNGTDTTLTTGSTVTPQ